MTGPAMHDTGDGPALLLLHAYPLDGSQWDTQVAALSDRYRCLRPDFPGCASSPPAGPETTIDSYARDLLSVLDASGVGEFAVCGSSMGGYAAFALLRIAPARVRAVILTGTRSAADTEAALQARTAVMERVRAEGVEAIVEPMTASLLCEHCRVEVHIADPVRGRIRRWTEEGVLSVIRVIMDRPDSTPLLGGIQVPTLVVCGTADTIVPITESRSMAAAIPGAQLEEFAGAAHLPNLEQPQRFSRLLGAFLDSAA